MNKVSAAILSFVTAGAFFAAMPTHAQSECALDNPAKGQEKITGQITGGPTGTLIEVTSESGSMLVYYNSSVLVCQGGQPASASVLALHATVVAYGPVKKKGKTTQMTATKILIAGEPRAAMQANSQMYSTNVAMRSGSVAPAQANSGGGSTTARDDWQSPSGGSATTQSSGATMGSSNLAGRDDWQGASSSSGPASPNSGSSQGTGFVAGQDNLQGSSLANTKQRNSNDISCNAIQFSVGSSGSAATGMAAGRTSTSGIICRIPVNQEAMEFVAYAAQNKRLGNITLNWQNQLVATLTNAEVSNVLFTWDGNSQVVEVTFSYQRAEISYLPSNSRVTF